MQHLDAHTGLLNARAWHDALESEIEQAEASGVSKPLTLVLLDVDEMGRVNAVQGIEAGDRLLVEIAEALRETALGTDHVARTGGEEFGMLLVGHSRVLVEALLVRLRARLPQKPTTCSMGVAHWQRPENVHKLLLRVDDALRQAKSRRRRRDEDERPEGDSE